MMIAIVVDEYDAAISHYVNDLGFTLIEDKQMSPEKRWVVVAPSNDGAKILLARAATDQQRAAIGNSTGGRVGFFMYTTTFDETFKNYKARGIEFIEQPLPPDQFSELLTLSQNFQTAIALDESVSSLKQLKECYELGWRGIYVIKSAIIGSPRQLESWFKNKAIDAVFSSVFETSIGQQAVLALAQELNNCDHKVALGDRKAALPDRALGFGVNQWFQDSDPNFLHLIS
jgi:hypothetical protein